MAKAKVTLRNEKNRSYNGVKFNQTITVDESESVSYLSAGFVVVSDTKEADAKAAAEAEKAAAEAKEKEEADAKAAASKK